MTKALNKAIMTRSTLSSKYIKWSSRENFLAFRKAKCYWNNLDKKTKKAFIEQMTERGLISSKSSWNTTKLFLTNKGFFTFKNITIEDKGKLMW